MQPASKMASSTRTENAAWRTSIHHVEAEDHGAVSFAAEDKTMRDEVAGLLRRELDLGSSVFADFECDVQFANAKAMRTRSP